MRQILCGGDGGSDRGGTVRRRSGGSQAAGLKCYICYRMKSHEGGNPQPMKKTFLKAIVIFLVFFIGACSIIALDTICLETTGEGGKLVLDVAN